MCQCWAANPNERPDFGEIVSIIGDLMDDKIRQVCEIILFLKYVIFNCDISIISI